MRNNNFNDTHISNDFKKLLNEYEDMLSNYMPNATNEEIEKYHQAPSNKTEEEVNYLIVSTIRARGFKSMNSTKEWFDKATTPEEKQTLGLLMLMTAFYGESFRNVQSAKNAFRQHICEVLENTEDNLRHVLDEIKYLWEYETVLSSIYQFGPGFNFLTQFHL